MKTTALFLALTLVPAALAGQAPDLRLIGEVRTRGEAERPALTDSADALTLLRTRLGLEARLSERALVFMQIQDSRTFGEEVSTTDGAADRIDLHQGWLQYGGVAGSAGRGVAWSARVGRQEIALGTERLIGAVGWSNTGRAFDGARVTIGPGADSWQLTSFAATLDERGRRLRGASAARDTDHLLLGAQLSASDVQLFALHDVAAEYRTATGVDRTTVGASVAQRLGAGFTASIEGAWQAGNQLWNVATMPVAQDLRAHMVGARLMRHQADAAVSRVGVGLDLLSGDEDPDDETYRAFNTLYATNHKFYGYIDFFLDPSARTRDRGLIDGMASATIPLPRGAALDVDAHAFWLQQRFAGAEDRLIGWELDLTMPVRLGPGQQLQFGYSAFVNRAAAPQIGLGRNGGVSHWLYAQASFTFGGSLAPVL